MSWDKSTTWTKRGKGFIVQVNHSARERSDIDIAMGDGPNVWNIYTYIYPEHRLFDSFDIDGHMWQDAATSLQLHSGPSFFKVHRADPDDHAKITAIQVGCDYNHLHDDHYRSMDESRVDLFFRDAEELFNRLSGEAAT